MQFFVNDQCIGCGMCEGTCPEVFHMTDDGVAEAVNEDVDIVLEDAALAAQDGCPVDAIEQK